MKKQEFKVGDLVKVIKADTFKNYVGKVCKLHQSKTHSFCFKIGNLPWQIDKSIAHLYLKKV